MKQSLLLLVIVLCLNSGASAQGARTFANPLLPAGADPWSFYKDGFYYYMHTTGRNLTVWKTRDITNLKNAESKVVWTPPAIGAYSRDIWAPEIHHIQGKWYIYFAADDGKNENHRLYVLECSSDDPMKGNWTMRGKIADRTDKWAIDGSIFEHRGRLYMVWSGWEGDTNGRQDIYIARLKNPTTIESERVVISKPEYPWEKVGDILDYRTSRNPPHVDVNEGPQILARKSKLHIVYSASGCWTEEYGLGLLTADADADLLDAKSWRKLPRPVFGASGENKVYAPGHNSFFKSPDGTQDWILYHANPEPGKGCGGRRSPRAQRFTWDADDMPVFGTPVAPGAVLEAPAGVASSRRIESSRRTVVDTKRKAIHTRTSRSRARHSVATRAGR